jgi:hypothetical protein
MKRENDLSERTLSEKLDGVADKQQGLGKLSPVIRAARKPKLPSVTRTPAAPNAALSPAARHAASLSTDLRARDKHGNPIPTLADRVRVEGYAAQIAPKKPKAKGKGGKK